VQNDPAVTEAYLGDAVDDTTDVSELAGTDGGTHRG
jgi:branched-chain amino acid transport system ATP-binding protein